MKEMIIAVQDAVAAANKLQRQVTELRNRHTIISLDELRKK